jgi:hypothetical protein
LFQDKYRHVQVRPLPQGTLLLKKVPNAPLAAA